MQLIKIGDDYINADRVVGFKTKARAQHPIPTKGYVDDAASIILVGSPDPYFLFDGQADALRAYLAGDGRPAIDFTAPPKAEPVTPAPAAIHPVVTVSTPAPTPVPPAPAAPAPTPKPVAPAAPVTPDAPAAK